MTNLTQDTRAVRAGLENCDVTGAVVPPLHLSSTYAFRGFGDKRKYDYSRSGNPTRDLLAEALTDLEGGAGAVITGSGMGAITLVGHLLPVGARIVAPHDCYGGTFRLLTAWNKRGELQVDFVDFGDAAAVAAALSKPAGMVWIETPSNPLLRITDIADIARRAHAIGALVMADNTFLSPGWQRPLELGADIVVHSTTKYINGHSDVVGGAVIAQDQGARRAVRLVGKLPRAHRLGLRQLPHAARAAHAAREAARTRPQRPGRGRISRRTAERAARVLSRPRRAIRGTTSPSDSRPASAPSSPWKWRAASMAPSASPRRWSCSRWRSRWAASRAWWRTRRP